MISIFMNNSYLLLKFKLLKIFLRFKINVQNVISNNIYITLNLCASTELENNFIPFGHHLY